MRVVLLEDNLTQSTLVTAWLRNAGHDVHSFALTRDLQRFCIRESVDLYLLDWMMPDISGEEFLRWLRGERRDNTPAIFITSRDTEDDVVVGLAAGADDFIIKPVSQRVLMSRIEAVLRRSKPREIEASLDLPPYRIEPAQKRILFNGQVLDLTEKEFDLAAFLFRNIGRLVSRGHLLEAVWGRNPNLATRTVDTHISRVRSKLNLKPENGFKLVPTYNFGYRLERVEPGDADLITQTAAV